MALNPEVSDEARVLLFIITIRGALVSNYKLRTCSSKSNVTGRILDGIRIVGP